MLGAGLGKKETHPSANKREPSSRILLPSACMPGTNILRLKPSGHSNSTFTRHSIRNGIGLPGCATISPTASACIPKRKKKTHTRARAPRERERAGGGQCVYPTSFGVVGGPVIFDEGVS